jgi:hypothetical protein
LRARLRLGGIIGLVFVATACLLGRLRADIPAPDNLVYGSILLNGQAVGAKDTNLVIEARRALSGPALASYRMGSQPAAGDLYLLKLKLEEVSPVSDPSASLAGQSVFVVIRDQTSDKLNLPYKILGRGSITRLDFGTTGPVDSDADGLPDAWEQAQFGNLNFGGSDDPNHTGQSLFTHFVDGTDPKQPGDRFQLTVSDQSASIMISFLTRQATGPGYDGLSRRYGLEMSTNLLSENWSTVQNLTNIVGDGTVFQYTDPGSGGRAFYRARVWLQAP